MMRVSISLPFLVAGTLPALVHGFNEQTPLLDPISTEVVPSCGNKQALLTCLNSSSVPFLQFGDPNFKNYTEVWNNRLRFIPAALAQVETVQDVVATVNCSREAGFKISVIGGGHSFASYGLGGDDGYVVVNMTGIGGVSVNPKTQVATVGGGLRLGQAALGLYKSGKRMIAHGVCPGVGVGGHVAYGGFGMISRQRGFALDLVVGFDVVLANGTLVYTSKEDHPELFWALRGAAPSYGIITKFHFRTYPAAENNLNFYYNLSYTNPEDAATAFEILQNWARTSAPPRLGLSLRLVQYRFEIYGVYFAEGNITTYNAKTEFLDLFAPVLTKPLIANAINRTSMQEKPLKWIDTLLLRGGIPGGEPLISLLPGAPGGWPLHSRMYAKSLMVPETNPLTRESLVNFFTLIHNMSWPSPEQPQITNTNWRILIDLQGGPNSAASTPNDTSFSNRPYLWSIQLIASLNDLSVPYPDDDGIPLLGRIVRSITDSMPGVEFKGYANFADGCLQDVCAWSMFYGDSFPKLVKVKGEVDPENLFAGKQNIPVKWTGKLPGRECFDLPVEIVEGRCRTKVWPGEEYN